MNASIVATVAATIAAIARFLYLRQPLICRCGGGVMFSECPSVSASVRVSGRGPIDLILYKYIYTTVR